MVGLFTAWLRADCCQCMLLLAHTPEGHCSLDAAGVLSICKRSDLVYFIHLNIPYVGVLWTSPALWDQRPHSGAAPGSGLSQPGSEHRQELRCAGRRSQPPSASQGCPLLQRLPRAGCRWATCACLLTTGELSCLPVGWELLRACQLLHAIPNPLQNKAQVGHNRGAGRQSCPSCRASSYTQRPNYRAW